MHFNACEAMHMLELRTTPQGHPEYRKICQDMHRQLAEKAGHRALAAMMSFVDHDDYELDALERLEGERRAEQRRAGCRRLDFAGAAEADPVCAVPLGPDDFRCGAGDAADGEIRSAWEPSG